MTITRMTAAMILAAMAAASAPAAQACQITRTPWGLRLTDCNLSDFFKNRYDLALDVIPQRPLLRMPNLRVTDIDGTLSGSSSVQLDVEVENSGSLNATRAFDVAVMATVHDPLAGGASVSSGPLPPVSIVGLAAGAATARVVGNVNLPNRKQDWDVCVVAVVDPPVVGGPAWGNIFESNETDNMLDRCCRVYGPTPDVSGPSAC